MRSALVGLYLLGVLLGASFIGACSNPPPPVVEEPVINGGPATAEEMHLITLHNDYRRLIGKTPPLAENSKLMTAARGHAQWMAANLKMSHTGKGGSTFGDRLRAAGYKFSYGGENIAEGYKNVQAVMDGWEHSAGHRQNILNLKYTNIGVGIAKGANGRLYWCVDFGRPLTTGAAEMQEAPEENLPEGLSAE